jgi:hypothetical protein
MVICALIASSYVLSSCGPVSPLLNRTTRQLAAVNILTIVAKFEADRTWMRPREGLEGGLRQTEAR